MEVSWRLALLFLASVATLVAIVAATVFQNTASAFAQKLLASAGSGSNAVTVNHFNRDAFPTLKSDNTVDIAGSTAFYDIAKLAASGKLKASLVCISADCLSSDAVFHTIFIAQALAQDGCKIVVSHVTPNSPAQQAWSDLLFKGVVRTQPRDAGWPDSVVTGHYVGKTRCVSQVIRDAMLIYCGLDTSPVTYYKTSEEREKELVQWFKNDPVVEVSTTTSAIHAAVLLSFIPTMGVKLADRTAHSDASAAFAVNFLREYFKVKL